MWTYKGVDIWPAGPVVFDGLRWYARTDTSDPAVPPVLRASSKQGMRELITHYLG